MFQSVNAWLHAWMQRLSGDYSPSITSPISFGSRDVSWIVPLVTSFLIIPALLRFSTNSEFAGHRESLEIVASPTS